MAQKWGSALWQSTNANSVLWPSWALIRNQEGEFLTVLCDITLPAFCAVNQCFLVLIVHRSEA